MRRTIATLLLGTTLLVASCKGQPLPADKLEYAGQWRGGGIELVITPDGGCSYHKVSGSSHVEISGPIKGFDGDDFVVGVMVIKTTFDVTAPPHDDNGTWKMTLDGVELTRIAK